MENCSRKAIPVVKLSNLKKTKKKETKFMVEHKKYELLKMGRDSLSHSLQDIVTTLEHVTEIFTHCYVFLQRK